MNITGKNRAGRPGLSYMFRMVMFAVIFLVMLNRVTELFRDKSGDRYILRSAELEKETDWDVIFAGSSRMNCAVYPMQLWRDYGFTSWNNAQSGEVIPTSYYTCKNIIRRCKPKVLVLDISMCYLDRKYGNTMWMHESLDPLPLRDRLPAILDIVPEEEREDFLFPLSIYHTRWNELTSSDFTKDNTLTKGCSQVFDIAEDIAGMSVEELPEEALRPGDIPVEYLDKIVELCKETDTQLVLTAIPAFTFSDVEKISTTHDMSVDPLIANWIAGYAEEKGIDYINFYPLADELGFDWFQHMYNYSHMNYWGGVIITDYLGQYLTERYDLPDRREDLDYQQWNDDLDSYELQVSNRIAKAARVPADVKEISITIGGLSELPIKSMITQEEYGDWVANRGVWLSTFNDVGVQNATQLQLAADASTVKLVGWMVDFWNEEPVKELYLQVGDEILQCEYGIEKADVVERFGIEEMRNCGFQITFPASLLRNNNVEEIYFIGVSADGKYLYMSAPYQVVTENAQ